MRAPLRVLPIPSAHPYVQHLTVPGGPGSRAHRDPGPVAVVHLPDPPVPGAPADVWWPPPALEERWIEAHAEEVDVVHLHFGTESRTPEQLVAWLDALNRHDIPLVLTVHDLDHPHLRDQRAYTDQLDLLVPSADAVLTLTDGAAARVEATWGRRCVVVPHPHVVPLQRIGAGRPAAATDGLRVGLHLKSLRTNLAPARVLPALLEAVPQVPGADLVVHAHPEVLDPTFARYDADLAELLTDLPGLHVVPRMDDDALWDYLGGLGVSVLPYAWGTHSGWVEACRDLGTWVLAPDVGHLREQGGVLAWGDPGRPPRVDQLVQLLSVAAQQPPTPVSRQQRRAEREQLARTHAEVYAEVLR